MSRSRSSSKKKSRKNHKKFVSRCPKCNSGITLHMRKSQPWTGTLCHPCWRKLNRSDSAQRPKVDYEKYMRSDEWAATRQRKFKTAGRHCHRCKSTERLEVHHKTYKRLGRERMRDLEVLCHDCHMREHGREEQPQDAISKEFRKMASGF